MAEDAKRTPGPWETSKHRNTGSIGTPRAWTYVRHQFPTAPYEGDLENEWGVYPPLGEAGPVALVAGGGNARLIAAAPDMLEALKMMQSALDFYVEEVGGIHLEDCPEDDTCECPNMKLVNGAWNKAEAAIAKATEPAPPEGGTP